MSYYGELFDRIHVKLVEDKADFTAGIYKLKELYVLLEKLTVGNAKEISRLAETVLELRDTVKEAEALIEDYNRLKKLEHNLIQSGYFDEKGDEYE